MIEEEKAPLAVAAKVGAATMPSVCRGVEVSAPDFLADAVLQMPRFVMVVAAGNEVGFRLYKDANRHAGHKSDHPKIAVELQRLKVRGPSSGD